MQQGGDVAARGWKMNTPKWPKPGVCGVLIGAVFVGVAGAIHGADG